MRGAGAEVADAGSVGAADLVGCAGAAGAARAARAAVGCADVDVHVVAGANIGQHMRQTDVAAEVAALHRPRCRGCHVT